MATEKQIEANKLNALKAGVKTDAGKEISKYNSLKHGLTAKTLLSCKTHSESKDLYDSIYDSYANAIQPKDLIEHNLVEEMVMCQIKRLRYEKLEGQIFIDHQDEFQALFANQKSDPQLTVESFDKLELLQKYKTTIENQFFRCWSAILRNRQAQQLDLF